MAMGATLPLLSRVIAGEPGGKRLSGLYAINTAGGAFGALAGAYAVLPALGYPRHHDRGRRGNVAIGLIAIVRAPPARPHLRPPTCEPRASGRRT